MKEIIHGLPTTLVDDQGHIYTSMCSLARMLKVNRKEISRCIKRDGYYMYNGHKYTIAPDDVTRTVQNATFVPEAVKEIIKEVEVFKTREEEAAYQEFLKAKEVQDTPVETYEFKFSQHGRGKRLAIALFSDAHIEETVNPASVLGLNEYNIGIAKKRVEKYFVNLVNCLNEDRVDDLIFASLGDTISGFIHEELAQNNSQTPLEATLTAQNLVYTGLKYICDNTKLKSIKFIGIVGNHSRVTKRIQHANGFKMSYEWLMYKNIEKEAKIANLPIEFYLPESELAVVTAYDRKFIMAHGFQLKSGTNTVCGIYPALNRLCMKWERVFHQDHVFIGHFHSCISIPNATVNGSIIGYNAYSLSNGFACERPAQEYIVYDSEIGELLNRKIYCD